MEARAQEFFRHLWDLKSAAVAEAFSKEDLTLLPRHVLGLDLLETLRYRALRRQLRRTLKQQRENAPRLSDDAFHSDFRRIGLTYPCSTISPRRD